jgi:hypothetical protein
VGGGEGGPRPGRPAPPVIALEPGRPLSLWSPSPARGLVRSWDTARSPFREGRREAPAPTEQPLAQVDRLVICVFLEKDETIYREKLPYYFPVGKYPSAPHGAAPGQPCPFPKAPGRLSLSSAFQPEAPAAHPDQDW